MTRNARNASSIAWAAIVLLAAATLAMWWPALHMPFWGDDYMFLLKAHAANAAAPWWAEFWPQSTVRFWRPLSQGGYWRVMLAAFGGSALAMHAASLALHLLASASVGWLAFSLGRTCRWPHVRRTAVLAAVIYCALALHMLPVHWAAAANNAMLTLFTALALSAWVRAVDMPVAWRIAALAAVPVALALALLCKESAVLIPLLMVTISVFAGRWRWSRAHVFTLGVCVALIVAWLMLDARFTAHTDAAYTLKLGVNVIGNAMAFVAWMLNVPREALRMVVVGDRWLAAAWIAATALPMLAVWYLGCWRGRTLLGRRQWLAVAVFAVLGYAPYFLLSSHSYAYYAAVAVMLPVIVLAHLAVGNDRVWMIAVLIAFSSWLAVAGSRHADRPALIARAQWGEHLLRQLERQPVRVPLWVVVRNRQRFYAVGRAGLAWRLDIAPQAIHLARQCPADARQCLVIEHDGGWHWRQAAVDDRL